MMNIDSLCHVLSGFGLAQAAQKPSGMQTLISLGPVMVFAFIVMYFLMIKPQQKKQKEHQTMVESMTKGDRVITIGGIHGTLVGVKKDMAVIKIAENVKIEINKSAITTVEKK